VNCVYAAVRTSNGVQRNIDWSIFFIKVDFFTAYYIFTIHVNAGARVSAAAHGDWRLAGRVRTSRSDGQYAGAKFTT